MKLEIDYSSTIQGEFKPAHLNIMLVMQVNCPGCFMYGIPALTTLYNEFKDVASFSILSTAFEDFDLNSEENTKALVEKGTLVGETKKAFAHYYNQDTYLLEAPFTVMFDRIINRGSNMNETRISEDKLLVFSEILNNHFMGSKKLGYTFAANLLQGTPTVIVFDENREIKKKWFGYKDTEQMAATIMTILTPIVIQK